MRRGSDDEEWQKVKEIVKARDSHCKLLDIISAKEYLILQKKARNLLSHCDPAHVFPVSVYPSLCYDPDNIVLLNRYSHEMMDSCRHPITGEGISRDERDSWWRKIIGDELYEILLIRSRSRQNGTET